MTVSEVRRISHEVYMQHNAEIINNLVSLKPTMTMAEAMKIIGCSRPWLRANRDKFGCKIINKRGVMSFDTNLITAYKRKQISK